ncbi:sialic acid-binding Ig-like lectin 10 [Labrus bergylta]|uniref:sialic acid-binding Ig-like lectin 10 n=1 Tax=Labrus bergylta TaxID=56723 RepID=UPI003313D7D3
MFVLMWSTLLFSVWGSNADVGTSLERREFCQGDFCITLIDGQITAEAGLCVVIPCSFTISYWFSLKGLVWFKCETVQRCGDSDVILSRNNQKIQPGFKGRVALLEPNLSQRNCSIIINDLTASDSGSYQLKVNLFTSSGRQDKFQYLQRATVLVKDLTQKPTLMIPPLTEGLQSTLTCTAPGLCSGSAPEITWMWRGGGGENDSHITGNITDFKTETLTDVGQRHSSTLSFTPSAKHHGTNITCKVGFTGGTTAEETVTLNVTYVKEVEITGNTSVREGELLQLTCSVESFPPSLVTWTKMSTKDIKSGSKPDVQNDTLANPENTTEIYLLSGNGQVTFSITKVTAKDSGQYICTANHSNITQMEKVDIEVIYMKTPVITGNTNLTKSQTLNLTCSFERFPPSHITWSLPGSNTFLLNGTGSATLVIPNVRVDNFGRYICTAKHLDMTVTLFTDVTLFPSIFENSGCEFQSGLLTCVCISEGFPLPTIRWPLLRSRTEYSVMTSVTNHTVTSTITLNVDDYSNTLAECVSSNENGEAKENLTIEMTMPAKKDGSRVLKMFSRLEVIVAFLIGALLSAVFCFLATKCHRKRQNSSGNLDKTLEMVTSQEDPLIDAGQEVEDDQTYDQEVMEAGGAVAEEKAALDPDGGPNDVEYASIDFSVLKRSAAKKRETTETEYAEIKKDVKEQREDQSGGEGEVMEDKEEEMMIGEDEETKNCVPEEEEGEDEAVYSNVKDVMDEI